MKRVLVDQISVNALVSHRMIQLSHCARPGAEYLCATLKESTRKRVVWGDQLGLRALSITCFASMSGESVPYAE